MTRVDYEIVADSYGNPCGMPKCPKCGRWMYAVSDKCPDCSEELDWSPDAITKLAGMLYEAGIPHEMKKIHDGYGIWYPDAQHSKGDVVKHSGSYGHKLNLLEAYGFDINKKKCGDDVIGYLTAEQAFVFFKNQYYKDCKKETDEVVSKK